MGVYQQPTGTVAVGGTTDLLARITVRNTPIVRADIASASYSVYTLDSADETVRNSIGNYNAVSLTLSDIIETALKTGVEWDVDAIGYNFDHTPNVSSGSPFTMAGQWYLVEYVLIPNSGQKIVFGFKLRAV